MPWPEILALVLMGGLAWFWHDSLLARDEAVKAARRACESEGLQLLDDTVALGSLRPYRDDEGRLKPRRIYHFEFSETGDNRRRGSVVVLGHRATVVHLGLQLVRRDDPLQ
ncbi:MAG: DUF3301 domain-containing protein [Rhodocyclaceae bacterium]|nr:DUF3301 domain-containing protein [Rhodocyclaceae bacterium]